MDVGHILLKPLSSFRPTSRCPALLVEGVTVYTSAPASGDCLDVEDTVTPRPPPLVLLSRHPPRDCPHSSLHPPVLGGPVGGGPHIPVRSQGSSEAEVIISGKLSPLPTILPSLQKSGTPGLASQQLVLETIRKSLCLLLLHTYRSFMSKLFSGSFILNKKYIFLILQSSLSFNFLA